MKMLKKYLIVILCTALICGLASCGAKETAGEKAASGDDETSAAVTEGETETAQTEITETEPLTGDESETDAAETEPASQTETTSQEKTESETATVSQKSENEYGEWGIAMSFEPTGAGKGKLVIRRLPGHGEPYGELMTGEKYVIKRYDNGAWIECDYINGTPQWIMIAYIISENDAYTKEIDYSNIYGVLAPGRYRIYKEISEKKTKGISKTFFAEFIIE